MLPRGEPALLYPRTQVLEIIAGEAGDPAIWRGAGADYLLYPNLLPVYGIAEPRPHNPLAPARYLQVLDAAFGFRPTSHDYFAPLRNIDHPLLDFLGVRVVLGSPAVPPSRTLERIDGGRFPPYTLLRNPDARPRWFFPDAVDVIERRQAAGWISGMKDAGRVAVFRDEAGSWQPSTSTNLPPKLLASSPGRIALQIPAGGEKLLATSIPLSRGWSASSSGRGIPTLTVNGAFLGVRLPAGASRVELRFLPPGLLAGCAAFGAAVLAVLLLLLTSPSTAPALRRRAR